MQWGLMLIYLMYYAYTELLFSLDLTSGTTSIEMKPNEVYGLASQVSPGDDYYY